MVIMRREVFNVQGGAWSASPTRRIFSSERPSSVWKWLFWPRVFNHRRAILAYTMNDIAMQQTCTFKTVIRHWVKAILKAPYKILQSIAFIIQTFFTRLGQRYQWISLHPSCLRLFWPSNHPVNNTLLAAGHTAPGEINRPSNCFPRPWRALHHRLSPRATVEDYTALPACVPRQQTPAARSLGWSRQVHLNPLNGQRVGD